MVDMIFKPQNKSLRHFLIFRNKLTLLPLKTYVHRAGDSSGSGRRDGGHSAGKGQGHGKDAGTSSSARRPPQGHEQGAKASGSGARGAGQGADSQGRGQGRGKDTGVSRTGKGAGDRGRDPRHGPEGKWGGSAPEPGAIGREAAQGHGGGGRCRLPGTGRAGRGGRGGRAGRRARDGERGAPAAGRPAGAVHPRRYPADAGAPHPPPPPRQPLQHRRQHGGPDPPEPPTPPYQPAPHPHLPAAREPRAEPARMAAALTARGSGAAPAPQVQSRHGAQRGRGAIRPGTRTRFRTPWGARSSPW